MISKEDLILAHNRISAYIHHTPVLTSETINTLSGCEVFFKCENFQKVGAFKYRGATNALLQLPQESLQNGVVTHSSGNHAQALALAAKKMGIQAYIVMPENSPGVKVDAVRGYGAEVILCPPNQKSREEFTREITQHTGATFVPPYNDERIICGQATSAKELLEEIPNLDYLIAPIGGGGLISGTILSAKYFSNSTKVIGAEPEGADDAYRSLKSGGRIVDHQPQTIADGLLTTLGEITWPIIRDHILDIITVSEDEIREAHQLVLERMKIVIEPSSATALAALFKRNELFLKKRVGIIISGGNYDLKLGRN
jgi:threonine dehydratase